MGIYAARSAVLVAAELGLGHPAARLLGHMALIVLDKPDATRGIEPCRFWQGRESLAIGVGYRPDGASSTAAHSAVKRALKELVDKGVVELVSAGHFGRASEYFLRLNSTSPSDQLTASLHEREQVPVEPMAPAAFSIDELLAPTQTADQAQEGVGERSPSRPVPAQRSRLERLQAGRDVLARTSGGVQGDRSSVPLGVGERSP